MDKTDYWTPWWKMTKPCGKTRHNNLESSLQKDLPTTFLLLFHYSWHLGRQWESSNIHSCESGIPLLGSGQALQKPMLQATEMCMRHIREQRKIECETVITFSLDLGFFHWSKKLVPLTQTRVVWVHKMWGFWEDLKLSSFNYSLCDFKELSRLHQPIRLVKSLHMLWSSFDNTAVTLP